MLCLSKYILFFLSVTILFSSCTIIEKRKYRDGYYIDWLSKNKNELPHSRQRIHREHQANSDSVLSANSSAPSVVNNASEKNILIYKSPINTYKIVFERDTLQQEKENKTKNGNKIKKPADGNTARILLFSFVAALLVTGIVLTFLFNYALWFVFFGLTALIVALLYSSLRKLDDELPQKFDERKDATKDNRKTPLIAIIGFSLGILSCASLIFFFGAVTIFSSIIGAIFSTAAIQKIKNNRSKFDGMGFAVAGFLSNILCVLFFLYLLGYFAFFY